MSEKTEEPTPKKLRKAAAEGDVPVSSALVAAAAFLAAYAAAGPAFGYLSGWASSAMREAPRSDLSAEALGHAAVEALWSTIALAAPVLGAAAIVAAAVGAVQAGGVFAPTKIAPDLARLSPMKGLTGLVSGQRLWGVARAVITSVAVVLVARSLFLQHAGDFAATLASPAKAAVLAGILAGRLVRNVALVLLAAALVDVLITRYSWRKRLRMSKDEVKREAKESEGDPHVKAARERAHHELLAQASIRNVKDATVVIVNPTHLAAALRYRDGEDEAPELVAKGEGAFAAQIIEAARAYGVPIVRDVPLARALIELEVGDEIPEALYEAVAEALRALWEREEGEPSDDA